MSLLTIGAFAKAARLSPKALRLYDDLGLLVPARVDPATGYRLYDPAQLERARLVAWLRRLGMPLARIRHVCGLEPAAAAQEIRTYWARVEADTTARRDLAGFLVDHLNRKDPAMTTASGFAQPPSGQPLTIRYAALSDPGLVRAGNQDAAYAGRRLLAVADGFGPAGAPAAAAAVDVLKRLETREALAAGDLLNLLYDAVDDAGRAVREAAAPESAGAGAARARSAAAGAAGRESGEPPSAEAGTTLTALLWTGTHLALVHIGDSRAYLLREGALFQITHDHTLVQSMVDDGRLTAAEALSHPQRSLLVRALTGGPAAAPAEGGRGSGAGAETRADVRLHTALPGDRYLLCSDGLTAAVTADAVREVLTATRADPDAAVRALVDLANAGGGPDNVSCVVADVDEAAEADGAEAAGAAATDTETDADTETETDIRDAPGTPSAG